jgi:hypothetical protein
VNKYDGLISTTFVARQKLCNFHGPDGLLDALACAAIARRIAAGLAQPFPKSFGRDHYGLPIAIWAWRMARRIHRRDMHDLLLLYFRNR